MTGAFRAVMLSGAKYVHLLLKLETKLLLFPLKREISLASKFLRPSKELLKNC
jgi:hypothetical protein